MSEPVAEQFAQVEAQAAASTTICGQKIVTSVGGVDVSAENLCPYHWQLKHGQADWKPPIVLEP